MRLSLITLSLVLAIFTLVVVAGFSVFNPGPRRTSANLLAAFLLTTAIALLNFFYVSSGLVQAFPRFALLGNSIGLASAPLLYLYARSLAVTDFRLHAFVALHFLPVVALLALVLLSYTFQPASVQLAILRDDSYPSVLNSRLLQSLIFTFVLAYLLLSARVLRQHRALYRQQHASTGLGELAWLRLSVVVMLLLALVGVLHRLVIARWPVAWVDSAFLVFQSTAAFLFGFYFLVQALRQSVRAAAPVALPSPADDKYGPHRLADAELCAFAQQIEAHLERSGAHLQGSISISELADQLPITARDLSQTLNRHFGLSFFDYINQRRCEHAKRLLAEKPSASVTDIQMSSGFSSKSSFYAAFKKCTGMTPTQYRTHLRATRGSAASPS